MTAIDNLVGLVDAFGLAARSLTAADLAFLSFTACNSVRVFAYVPQIRSVARDRNGASAISLTTWGMFAVSHLSTMAYGHFVVADGKMALIFGANTLCCLAILALTLAKRAQGPARPYPLDEARRRARAA